ncbi:hypothetical protein EP073_05765 [Geovibrio thiophilus]|uniref:TonB C-terminal domain-containing protein n=1 Tax=Geovibrio thiophilus TaxID=139438 RepID=A0A3R5UYI5_9BACT|nr:hypothetical protein [Geovibrio thiophilus]QAR32929.1 hypothetical protein EP073_05765 [Geovibrio thiophilus]
MARLFPFVLISILAHIALLGFIPKFEVNFSDRSEPVEVEIIPPRPKILPKPPVKVTGVPDRPAENPFRNIEPTITMPELDIPKVDVDTDYEVEIPDLKVSRITTDSEARVDNRLLSEIQSTRETVDKETRAGQGEKSDAEAKEYADSSFFVLENISNTKRRITHVPPKPSFSLANNTKVNLRFKIDKQGTTYGIVLITRSDSNIEKLAVEFVERLKFNSVTYATNDSAEITLYFKVR